MTSDQEKYEVFIRIKSQDGYTIRVTLRDCPRDALLKLPGIGDAVKVLDQSRETPSGE